MTINTPSDVLRLVWRIITYTLLIIAALIFLMPVYMVIVTSLKDPKEINLNTAWDLPSEVKFGPCDAPWDIEGKNVLDKTWNSVWNCLPVSFGQVKERFGAGIANSFKLVTMATIFSALLGSINGYILSKWHIPGEKILFPLMLFGMFIPYQAILIPLFEFMRDINLYNTIWGLILIHVVYGLPITTLIFRNYYVEIPDEMLEAGSMDGANFFQLYTRIVFPLSLPAFVVVIIWQFTQVWNEFLFAVTITPSESAQPITVGLSQLTGGQAVSWNLPMAGAIVAALPPLIVYIVAGRYFIRGLLAGSVKG